jgi:hypothetical protein
MHLGPQHTSPQMACRQAKPRADSAAMHMTRLEKALQTEGLECRHSIQAGTPLLHCVQFDALSIFVKKAKGCQTVFLIWQEPTSSRPYGIHRRTQPAVCPRWLILCQDLPEALVLEQRRVGRQDDELRVICGLDVLEVRVVKLEPVHRPGRATFVEATYLAPMQANSLAVTALAGRNWQTDSSGCKRFDTPWRALPGALSTARQLAHEQTDRQTDGTSTQRRVAHEQTDRQTDGT